MLDRVRDRLHRCFLVRYILSLLYTRVMWQAKDTRRITRVILRRKDLFQTPCKVDRSRTLLQAFGGRVEKAIEWTTCGKVQNVLRHDYFHCHPSSRGHVPSKIGLESADTACSASRNTTMDRSARKFAYRIYLANPWRCARPPRIM